MYAWDFKIKARLKGRIYNYELRIMNYELRIMNYELWIMNYDAGRKAGPELCAVRPWRESGII